MEALEEGEQKQQEVVGYFFFILFLGFFFAIAQVDRKPLLEACETTQG